MSNQRPLIVSSIADDHFSSQTSIGGPVQIVHVKRTPGMQQNPWDGNRGQFERGNPSYYEGVTVSCPVII